MRLARRTRQPIGRCHPKSNLMNLTAILHYDR
jgi:hypothetical protein